MSGVVSLPAGAPAEWLGAVQVSAQPVSGPGYKSVWVDPATGTYSLTDLAPGSYRIQFSVNQVWDGSGFSRPNLVSEYYDDATDWNSAAVVDVSGASASSIDAQLATGRTISGRVTLPEGSDPAWLSAISVNASAPTSGSGYAQVDPATGAYSITGLAPGAYQVHFSVGTFWGGSTSVKPNLVSEYYDDTTDWTTATPVDVSTGDKSGIDAALEQGRSITGTVSLPAGAPSEWLNSVSVSASAVNESMVGGLSARPDSTTGEYTLTGLAPGAYQVAFRVMTVMPGAEPPNLVDEYYDNARTISAATPVDITSADESGINATLESGRSISGTVSLPADAPEEWMQAARVSVMTPDGEYLSYGDNTKIDTTTGAYTLSRLPAGDFVVYFSASSYYDGTQWTYPDLAPEYYDDAANRDDATVVSTTSGNAAGIDAALAHGAGIDLDLDASALLGTGSGIGISITDLDGNVLTSYGDPLPEDGHYPITMGNLTPGGYRIAVTTMSWDEQTSTSTLESAQFLRFGSATSIQLTAGHTETGQVTARAADSTISGNIHAEGFATTGNVLGSALPYEKLDGNWTRIPEVHFDTTQNGDTPYSLTVPSGTYTIGYETDYSPATTPVQEQWWNGKNTLAAADPITLTTGQTRTDINGTIQPTGDLLVERTAGVDRYATSAAVSAATFDPGTPVAYLANGTKFPDALSGAAAAGHLGGPVLLTQENEIPGLVAQELKRLHPDKIIVLGSDASITDNVLTQAKTYASVVERTAGVDRYATSAAVSAATFDPGTPVAYLANGTKFPDALSGAAAAGHLGGP
ncbi:cell wall-binding repeat-containing protein, partial [Microbacterium ureisolvens]|uniref:cell wall-binding repeat-containing protein n=1 Tax=Microbacterium ureisolvens TaxID=2781186 RepID=UPI001C6DFB58